MLKIADVLAEITFPLRSLSVLVTLVTFVLLFWLADAAGLLGIGLLIVLVPAFTRYLMIVLEARAGGNDVPTPDVDMFTPFGNLWSLFLIVPVMAFVILGLGIHESFGAPGAWALIFLGMAVLPASAAVLAVTHSPLESINPVAIFRLIARCGDAYWVAPGVAMLAGVLLSFSHVLPRPLLAFFELYLMIAVFAAIGGVIRPFSIVDDIDIPDDTLPDEDSRERLVTADRQNVLTHAYGFVSRGNRDGGLNHIYAYLAETADPDPAWQWFFEEMLRWEDSYPALLLAQQYLGRLLELDRPVEAVKLMMRCRLISDAFRPLSADLPRAISAARSCGNSELAAALGS